MQEAFARLYARRVPLDERGLLFNVTFVNRGGPQRLVGPVGTLWLEARELRAERLGPVLAVNYYSLEAEAPVLIQFAGGEFSRSHAFGPFTRFSIVDRMVYVDGKAFALYSPKLDQWLCYDAGRHWPVMVISPSGPARER